MKTTTLYVKSHPVPRPLAASSPLPRKNTLDREQMRDQLHYQRSVTNFGNLNLSHGPSLDRASYIDAGGDPVDASVSCSTSFATRQHDRRVNALQQASFVRQSTALRQASSVATGSRLASVSVGGRGHHSRTWGRGADVDNNEGDGDRGGHTARNGSRVLRGDASAGGAGGGGGGEGHPSRAESRAAGGDGGGVHHHQHHKLAKSGSRVAEGGGTGGRFFGRKESRVVEGDGRGGGGHASGDYGAGGEPTTPRSGSHRSTRARPFSLSPARLLGDAINSKVSSCCIWKTKMRREQR